MHDKLQPKLKIGCVGDSIEFTCLSDIKVKWKWGGDSIPNFTSGSNGSVHWFKLLNVGVEHSGVIICHGMEKTSSVILSKRYFEDKSQLIVFGEL